MDDISSLVGSAIDSACQVSHNEHLMIIFVVQLLVQFSLALFNYFAFTKNPTVKSHTLFEAVINILKSILTSLLKRRSP